MPAMEITTDFSLWCTFDAALEEPGEIASLYKAVEHESGEDPWTIEHGRNGAIFVCSNSTHSRLFLASEKAKRAFLYHINQRYMRGTDLDPDTWYSLKVMEYKDRDALERENRAAAD